MTTHSTHFAERPHTRLGWWATWLMVAFAAMFLVNSFVFMALPSLGDGTWRQAVLPFYGIAMLLCGLAAGIVGIVAIAQRHERSWMVWLAVLPLLWTLFMLLGEFLFPH